MNWKIGASLGILLCVSGYGVAQSRVTTAPHTFADAGMAGCENFPGGMRMQFGPPPGPGHRGMLIIAAGHAFGIQEHANVVKGEPYQAEAVTTIRQTLADGTHIDQTITAKVARDEQGRSFRSEKLGDHGPFFLVRADGGPSVAHEEQQPPILTTIFDPVANEHIDFVSDDRVAHVFHMTTFPFRLHPQSNEAIAIHGPQGPVPILGAGPAFPPGTPGDGGDCDVTVHPLGDKKIDGIEVVGTRRAWTVPAGAIGNDRAIVTTEDTWYSPKLKLVLLSVRNDPRVGQTTYALKDLKLTNPNESLFRIPPGYKVERLGPPPLPPPPGVAEHHPPQ